METASLMEEVAHQHLINQFWLALLFIIPMILVARAVVAGTRYSPILIIVVFGLLMGFLLVSSGVSTPGLFDFPMLGLMAQTTIVALAAAFFVGGQELRRVFSKEMFPPDQSVVYSFEQVFFGTGRTQVIFILRAFFLLLGLEALTRLLLGSVPDTSLARYYPLLAYMGLIISVILIDHKATIKDKRQYLYKGVTEMSAIVLILLAGAWMARVSGNLIALPPIFFVMLVACGLGVVSYRWRHGPAIRCLLFAGIPVVLAANFIIGGSRIVEAFELDGMNAVLAYGFFGQLFWMFGGISVLLFFGRTNWVRNIGPGMAGALSHAGLTGACTAGDLGEEAAKRAPIMINIPFFGHVFVFSILALSIDRGLLLFWPSFVITAVGLCFLIVSVRGLSQANGNDAAEVKALMQFSFGWQLLAVFGGLLLLRWAMPVDFAIMATSSALSHFGLFAAIQGGMAGGAASEMIAFVFAMPFLIHPLVFFLFGRAMENNGAMSPMPVFLLAGIGLAGVLAAVLFL